MTGIELSVVVPCYNEQDSLRRTHERLAKSLRETSSSFEIIYVNDGSTDKTAFVLRGIIAADPRAKFIEFSRNFGQAAAITAGLEFSSGAAVVVMDADLQDPPELIPTMAALWRKGFDVVYARRLTRDGETRMKRWTAAVFYRVLNALSDVPLPIDVGEFRLMDRCVVSALCSLHERHRYVRGLVSWLGYRQTSVVYSRESRRAGVTKFTFAKMVRTASDALFSFSLVPLRAAIWTGFFAALLALVGIGYAIVLRVFTNIWVSGWTLLFIAVAFLGGAQLVFLGVLGEYIGRIVSEVKQRPLYIVADGQGFDAERSSRICRRVGPIQEGDAPCTTASHDEPMLKNVR